MHCCTLTAIPPDIISQICTIFAFKGNTGVEMLQLSCYCVVTIVVAMLVIPTAIAEQLCQLYIFLMRAKCLADSVCIVLNKMFACLLLFAYLYIYIYI